MEATLKGYFPVPHTIVVDTSDGVEADAVVADLNAGIARVDFSAGVVLDPNHRVIKILARIISKELPTEITWRVDRPSQPAPVTPVEQARHRAQFLLDEGVACVYEDRLEIASGMLATARLVLEQSGIGLTERSAINYYMGSILLLEKLGRKGESMPLCVAALALAERILDDQHPDKAACFMNLGELQLDRGHRRKALANLTRAVLLLEGMTTYPDYVAQLLAYAQPLLEQARTPRQRVVPLRVEVRTGAE